MEREIHRVTSLRRDSSLWRRDSNVFSRSSSRFQDEEDDEEALRWAAIERLPTYDRMRKGILLPGAVGDVGGAGREVDILGLGLSERKNLIERLMRTAEEDNERFLLKLRDRMERYDG
jgi:hypothetical protein